MHSSPGYSSLCLSLISARSCIHYRSTILSSNRSTPRRVHRVQFHFPHKHSFPLHAPSRSHLFQINVLFVGSDRLLIGNFNNQTKTKSKEWNFFHDIERYFDSASFVPRFYEHCEIGRDYKTVGRGWNKGSEIRSTTAEEAHCFRAVPPASSSFSELCIDGKKGKKEKSDTLGSFVERIYREDASPSRIRLG